MPIYGPDVTLDNPAYIDETVRIFGKVTIGDGASVWPNVVMRAEQHEIVVGRRTNIQDFTMVHVGSASGSIIGQDCSITHHCTIHGCTIGDACLIGINAVIMDGAVIGENSIVGQNAFVRENQEIPPNSIVVGVPAAVKAERNSRIPNSMNAFLYYENAIAYSNGYYRRWSDDSFWQLAADEMDRLKAEMAREAEAGK
ncbi:gamma carbonic anhydrase family protein [Minwuia thermotolerans]|jgi:carbonic anhydrase/acetyltransferase-like protein (isoleucine patch superfamily)|uniref:Gamma carbonic anhydrase family protein n=1 Tax=Minwuia thermotolerans TaxID=2056226 RepID=A0A2M9FZ71_9PROT|nr:gamma carbonic anhydrase family protein [Minwuia thermotolerans]ANK80784.1 MAG: gamma carbonic anhydrase family protein [Rhizobiales bacterium NRL2]PJK28767.1 gamma carbonic anhydrase family protein [Minwuia thermotolerans]